MHTGRALRTAGRLSRIASIAGLAGTLTLVLWASILPSTIVSAADTSGAARPRFAAPAASSTPIYVATATGVVDNVMAGYIEEAVKRAAANQTPLLVIQLNTPGGSLDATQRIVTTLLRSPIPVAVYVTPSGGRAASAGTFIPLA